GTPPGPCARQPAACGPSSYVSPIDTDAHRAGWYRRRESLACLLAALSVDRRGPRAAPWVRSGLLECGLGLVEERIVEMLADPAVDVLHQVLGDLALLGDGREPDAGRGHIETRLREIDRAQRVEVDGIGLGIVHLLGNQLRGLLLAVRLDPVDALERRAHELLDRVRVLLHVGRGERQLQALRVRDR